MKPVKLSLDRAKKVILQAQLLNSDNPMSPGIENTEYIVNHLGYVQIDTISVIQRCHHHILWTRFPEYNNDDLHMLQKEKRAIFEYWGHAMSYMPMRDFRYSLPRMKNMANPQTPWSKEKYKLCGHLLEPVLKRIREEGPLGAKDFEHVKKENSGWWDWKPAKVALELLFWRGELMINERNKFQKIYDLTERVLPDHIDKSFPTENEIGLFLVRRALQSLGIANEKEILNFMQPGTTRDSDLQIAGRESIVSSLQELIEEGEVTPVLIPEADNSINYMATGKLNENIKLIGKPFHIFSPFDNLVIQRQRTKRIFDFNYTLECYVPETKRTYGYFVLPLLWGDQFVGRMDAKADRKKSIFDIKNIFFEEYVIDFDGFLPELAKKIKMFSQFNGCSGITIAKTKPPSILPILKRLINSECL